MKVTLLGFGEVGSLVGALINTTFENVRINVMNTQSSKSGRILDLEHAAVIRNNVITHNDRLEHQQADIVIYSAGFNNAHGESRNSVAQKNKELVFSLFKNVNYSNKPTIIVITNPVEPISFWIKQVVGEHIRVIGTGTALDTFRLKYILSKKFNCSSNEIDCLVIGEHGQHMVPVYSQTTVQGKQINDLCSMEELAIITNELIHSAFQIRETEKATKYGIAETSLFLMKAVISNSETITAASFGDLGNWKTHLNIPKDIFLSLPYKISAQQTNSVYFNLTEIEQKELQLAVDSITQQVY